MKEKEVVVFGAGSAGKGLLGLLFHQAGYKILFVDIDPDVVDKLQASKGYQVLVHGLEGNRKLEQVTGYTILPAQDRERVAHAITTADLVLTAVFVHNLPDVAKTIALAITQCRKTQRQTPLNCLACENMKKSSSTLAQHVYQLLDPEDLDYCKTLMGFPDCMINRVVPKSPDPLSLETEDYCEWTSDAGTRKGPEPPHVTFIEWVHNQQARLDRKLMVYNGPHAATAYFGHLAGYTWLYEVMKDERVCACIQRALDQLADVVRCHHGFSTQDMETYKRDFWLRCRNPGLKDPVARVARQPQRKLGRHERLIGPAKLAQDHGLPREHILQVVRAALQFQDPQDEDSLALTESLQQKGLRRTLVSVCGLAQDDPLIGEIENTAPISFTHR